MTTSKRIRLFLSGGGTRAMAFHTGCIDGIARLGLLENVDLIRTVSSASLLTSLIYKFNDGRFPTSEEFIKNNLKKKLIETLANLRFERLVKQAVIRNLLVLGRTDIHAAICEVIDLNFLPELRGVMPTIPVWEICALDMESTTTSIFRFSGRPQKDLKLILNLLSASICLIPRLKPMRVNGTNALPETDEKLLLADAGITDFLGVGSLSKDQKSRNSARGADDLFIVSDASLPLPSVMNFRTEARFWSQVKELSRLNLIVRMQKDNLCQLIGKKAFIDISLQDSFPYNEFDCIDSRKIYRLGSLCPLNISVSMRVAEIAKEQILAKIGKRYRKPGKPQSDRISKSISACTA